MKPLRAYAYFAAMGAMIIGVAVLNARAWLQRVELQTARDLARIATRELPGLRAENRRLHDKQIPAAEFAALRADHQALERLRAEFEFLANQTPSTRQ